MFRQKDTKGFTLIELLVVVGIIGMLSSVVLVAVFSGRSRARDGRRKADIKQLQGAVELYANSTSGLYPLGTEGSAVDVSKGAGCTENPAFITAIVTGGYLPALPVTPPGVGCYRYYVATGRVAYKIGVKMENPGDADAENDGGVWPTQEKWFEVFGGVDSNTFPL